LFDVTLGKDVSHIKIIDPIVIGFSDVCIRIRGIGVDWEVVNPILNSGRLDGDQFAVGVGGNESCSDVRIIGGVIENCTDTVNAYWNADGVSNEEENDNWIIG